LDRTFVEDITPDGRTIVFHEGGIGGAMISGRSHGAAFLRRTDGSPAVRLGVGQPLALSPDGKWVILVTDEAKARMALHPTGAGDSRELPAGTVRQYYDAWWFPDGRRLLIAGNEENRPRRLFIQDLSGGDPKPFTPEGVWTLENAISPDGKWVAAGTRDEGAPMSLYPVEEGEIRAIPGLSPKDYVLRWSPDARHLFVAERNFGVPLSILRLDLETGVRELWKELMPADPAGVPGFSWICLTPDGRSYAYTHRRILSDLYLVEE
jgi:Tol biopolymer transport system component